MYLARPIGANSMVMRDISLEHEFCGRGLHGNKRQGSTGQCVARQSKEQFCLSTQASVSYIIAITHAVA